MDDLTPATVQVGCAGILVVDLFAGPLPGLPDAGQLMVVDRMAAQVGGCAANVASLVAKQGLGSAVAGCVGADHSAKLLYDELLLRGVDCQQVTAVPYYSTAQTIVLVVAGEDRRFIHMFGANEALQASMLDRRWVLGLKLFYVGGLFAMPNLQLEELAKLLAQCRSGGVLTVLDVVAPEGMTAPSGLDACLAHCDFFLPNEYEAHKLSGQEDVLDQAKFFRDRGVSTTVISQGEDGAFALCDDDCWKIAPCTVDFRDGTGCGDAFAAGLISGVMRHDSLEDSLAYATVLGGSCATQMGAYDGVFDQGQADDFLSRHPPRLEHESV